MSNKKLPGGLTAEQTKQLHNRFEQFLPKLANGQDPNRELFKDVLPDGANWAPKTAQMVSGGNYPGSSGKTNVSPQQPYQPEFASPDRQQYPVHRILANRYWRLFYKLDPVIGTCIDLYGDLPWSQFKLTGPGVEGSILHTMESTTSESNLISMLPMGTREYFVCGEMIPQTFFDNTKGYWTHIALHNPDQIEVIDAPFINMDPILEFVPDDRLRSIVTSNHPAMSKIKKSMPAELISRLQSRQNIPLSPINATFLPRKLHPYDTRGTSILSRLWRVLMYEDAVFSASIQTARRAASPLKVALLGDPQSGWIPGPEHEQRLLQLLAQAELDPHSWLTYHYGVKFELHGVNERAMSITRENEAIERMKLVALGVSKSFLHGEISYACLPHNTNITTPDGKQKYIQDIMIGDRVIDKNGHIQTVEAAWCEGVPNNLVNINMYGIGPILATINHKFPVWAWLRKCACGCGKDVKPGKCFIQHHHQKLGNRFNTMKLQYVDGETCIGGKPRQIPIGYNPIQELRADQIRKDDYLMIPRKFDEIQVDVSLAKARLLGYYIAEGCSDGKYGQVRWCLGGHEINTLAVDIINQCTSICVPARAWKSSTINTSTVITSTDEGQNLLQWFIKYGGEYSYAKQFNEEVMRWPLSLKEELVRGMYRGDGSQFFRNIKSKRGPVYQQYVVAYTTVSHDLAIQLQSILVHLGIFACIDTEAKRIGKDGSPRRELYIITSHGRHAHRLANLVWGDNSLAKNIVIHNSIRDRYRVDDDYIYIPVRSVEIVDNDQPVYNMTVSGDHSYLANGVGTYNSAATGLQVFLGRLKALRNYIETAWIINKLFYPLAEINGWIRSKPSEVQHRFRVKRSHKELIEQQRYIIPKIIWEKSLDPSVDAALVQAMNTLEQIGCRFSKTTKMATVGISFEDETKKISQEQEFERQYLPKIKVDKPQQPGGLGGIGGPMGGPGLDMMPPSNLDTGELPSELNIPEDNENTPPIIPAGASVKTGFINPIKDNNDNKEVEPPKPTKASQDNLQSTIWHSDQYNNWSSIEVSDLIKALQTGESDNPFWQQLVDSVDFKDVSNPIDKFEVIDQYLIDNNYPESDINDLRFILTSEQYLIPPDYSEYEKSLDTEGMDLFSGCGDTGKQYLSGDISDRINKIRNST
jgi:hypothetical protein